jgi:uncharacterized phosphosugar-binding protein
MLDRYVDAASHTLGEVAATQGEALEEAARLVAAGDADGRAGGLACVNPILDPALSPATGPELARGERTSGRARRWT